MVEKILLVALIPGILVIYMMLYEIVLDMRANRKRRENEYQEIYNTMR